MSPLTLYEMSYDSSSQSTPSINEETNSKKGRLDLNQIFEILSHPYRRIGLRYLLQNGRAAPVGDLYDHIAHSVDSQAPRSEIRSRVKATFHHCHRPKLEGAKLIEYDEEAQVVRVTEQVTKLKPYLAP